MASVQEILSQINDAGGLARPNRFAVQITPPRLTDIINNNQSLITQITALQQAQNTGQSPQSLGILPNYFSQMGIDQTDSATRLDFMCCKAELPNKTFNATDVRTYGAYFQMPFVDVYSTIPLMFIVGHDMFERNFFDAWMYTVQDPSTSDFNYVNEYASTVDIYQLDEFDIATYGIRLFQAWPLTQGEMTLEYEEMNSYHKLPVTFTYRKWINLLVNSGTPTSINPAGGPPASFESTIFPQGTK